MALLKAILLLYKNPGAACQGAGAGCTGSCLQLGKKQSARQQNPKNEKRVNIGYNYYLNNHFRIQPNAGERPAAKSKPV